MKKINKPTSPENQTSPQWQTEITDNTNLQLIKILPSENDEDVLIGQEIQSFWSIEKIIWHATIASREVILVENSSSTKFYIYKDTHKVVRINDSIWRPRWEYIWEIQERLTIFWKTILRTKTYNGFDMFVYEDSLKTYLLNNTDKIFDIKHTNIGDKKVIVFKLDKGSKVIDANTWEYIYAEHRYNKVKTKIIDILSDRESPIIKLWNNSSLKKVTIEKENQNTYIDTKTLKIFYIEEIYGNVEHIENNVYIIGNNKFLKCHIVDHPFKKYYYINQDTWKLFIIPWTNYVVEWYAPGVSPVSAIRPISRWTKFLGYTLFSFFTHEIGSNETKQKLFTVDQNSLQEVKLPGTDFIIDDLFYDHEYRDQIAIWKKSYVKVSISDIQKPWQLYFSPEDNSIAHISTIDWKKHIVNNLWFPAPSYGSRSGSYKKNPLFIWGKEIIPAFINKSTKSILIDNQTFQEVIIKVFWTDEEINLIRHDMLDIWWEEIIQVWTKSWKNIYIYKKTLSPLQVPWLEWYVEDIKKLEDDKWNMKVNGKWNLVRVK